LNPQKFTKDETRDFARMTLGFSMAKFFCNNSPGALTLEEARAREISRVAEQRRQTGTFGAPNAFAANPSEALWGAEKPEQPSNKPEWEKFFDSMSKSDLQRLKSALNRAIATTGVVELAVGAAFLTINPVSYLVFGTFAALVLAQIGFDHFANMIDVYLYKQENSGG
jgi:hypothetical protein